jgi:hypothetical protein
MRARKPTTAAIFACAPFNFTNSALGRPDLVPAAFFVRAIARRAEACEIPA